MDVHLYRKRTHTELLKYYEPKGFSLRKENGVFHKNGSEVHWGVTSEYSDYIFFQPSLVLKNKKISEVMEVLFPDLPAIVINKIQGRDLAREFGISDYDYLAHPRYDIDKGASYKVGIDTDLNQIVEDHSQYMEKVGFNFFRKVDTVEGIDSFINDRILNPSIEKLTSQLYSKELMMFFTNHEILSGLIVAHLTRNSKLDLLLDRYKIVFAKYPNVLSDLDLIRSYFNKNQIV